MRCWRRDCSPARPGYDIVVPSATFLQRQIKAGVLQPIDRKQLANAATSGREIDGRLVALRSRQRAMPINYMWYTTGVAYNVAKIKERLGDKPITSWDQVLRPEAFEEIRRLRRLCARQSRRYVLDHAELPEARSQLEEPRRSAPRRRSARAAFAAM